jgi:hypothetical protein
MENENKNAGGLKREVMIRFRVTEAERDFIFDKMRLLGVQTILRLIYRKWQTTATR